MGTRLLLWLFLLVFSSCAVDSKSSFDIGSLPEESDGGESEPGNDLSLQVSMFDPSTNVATDETPTIQVEGMDAGEEIRLYDDSTCSNLLVTVTVSDPTSLQITLPILAEGTHEIYGQRVPAEADASECSSQLLSYTVDLTGPDLSIESPTLDGSNTFVTNTSAVSFSGSCETGEQISVTGADNSSADCIDGEWTYNSETQSTDASRIYTFTQEDAVGNSSSVSAQWTRETVPLLALSATGNESIVMSGGVTPGTAVVITVSNNGTRESADFSSAMDLSNTTNFAIASTTCGSTLAAGANCTVSVEPQTLVNGAFAGTFTINVDNAPSINLSGTATGFFCNSNPTTYNGALDSSDGRYVICNATQLNDIGDSSCQGCGLDYKLIQNVDASTIVATDYNFIGTSSTPFSGHFDGGGFSITGLSIDKSADNDVGLFGVIEGVGSGVENLNVQFDTVNAQDNSGALVGTLGSDALIRNVSVDITTFSARRLCGAVAGIVDNGATVNQVQLTVDTASGDFQFGAAFGHLRSGSVVSQVQVTGTGSATVSCSNYACGGLAGRSTASLSQVSVESLAVNGTSSGGPHHVSAGGLVGLIDSPASTSLEDAYVRNVDVNSGAGNTGGDHVGGLVGRLTNDNMTFSRIYVDASVCDGACATATLFGPVTGVSTTATVTDVIWENSEYATAGTGIGNAAVSSADLTGDINANDVVDAFDGRSFDTSSIWMADPASLGGSTPELVWEQ